MMISLSVTGENLDPEALSDALGVKPDKSYVKGDSRSKINAKFGFKSSGGWFLHIDVDDDMTSTVDTLLTRLEGFNLVLRDFDGVEQVNLDVFHSIPVSDGENGMGEVSLTPHQLSILAKHKIELTLSYDAYQAEQS